MQQSRNLFGSVQRALAESDNNYMSALGVFRVLKERGMNDTPLELILLRKARYARRGIEAIAHDDEITGSCKRLLRFRVTKTNCPAFSILPALQLVNPAIELDLFENPEMPCVRIQVRENLIAGWKCRERRGHRPVEKLVRLFRQLQVQRMVATLPDTAERALSLVDVAIKPLLEKGLGSYQPANPCSDDPDLLYVISHLH
jgi:hypothetical protein